MSEMGCYADYAPMLLLVGFGHSVTLELRIAWSKCFRGRGPDSGRDLPWKEKTHSLKACLRPPPAGTTPATRTVIGNTAEFANPRGCGFGFCA